MINEWAILRWIKRLLMKFWFGCTGLFIISWFFVSRSVPFSSNGNWKIILLLFWTNIPFRSISHIFVKRLFFFLSKFPNSSNPSLLCRKNTDQQSADSRLSIDLISNCFLFASMTVSYIRLFLNSLLFPFISPKTLLWNCIFKLANSLIRWSEFFVKNSLFFPKGHPSITHAK